MCAHWNEYALRNAGELVNCMANRVKCMARAERIVDFQVMAEQDLVRKRIEQTDLCDEGSFRRLEKYKMPVE